MDDILSWILGILVLIWYFAPMVLGFLSAIATFVFAIWAIIDILSFKKFEGKIKRGFRISSKPLSNELRHYLENLSRDIVEYRETPFGKDLSGFIRKQDGEVLIHAKQWYGFRWRRSWPFIGYVNLLSPNPVLEFRSSLPFHLFLISLALSIILLPFVLAMWAFSFNMETQTIEKFLQSKVESTISQKVSTFS